MALIESEPLTRGTVCRLSQHEVEELIALYNVRQLLSNPEAMRAHKQTQASEAHQSKRARALEVMDQLSGMMGSGDG